MVGLWGLYNFLGALGLTLQGVDSCLSLMSCIFSAGGIVSTQRKEKQNFQHLEVSMMAVK